MDLVGKELCGRYRILRRLGAGGMGTVYLAEHSFLGRPTALKVLRRDLATDPDAEERFRREAKLAARIDHPAVAQIYDFDRTDEGAFVLAMEYVEGETVAQRLRREGPLPTKLTSKVLREIADGLDRAHTLRILHRDLKPENVMLMSGGRAKLLDFGVARPLETSGITSSGFVVGTPTYMSPEQLVASPLSPATDVYSLGVVVYEMLAGAPPHSGASYEELRAQRFTREPLSLDRVRDDCPPALAAAVTRALALDPGQRWPSAGAFANAVWETLSDLTSSSTFVAVPGTPHRLDVWEAHFEGLRFAGRDRDVRIARDAWATARAGRPTLLWIEGDEGAGKTAFFQLALRDAGGDAAALLVGRGYHEGLTRPYSAWQPILRTALSLRGAEGRPWPAVSSLLAPGLAGTPEAITLADEVGALLRAIAREGPVFVGIEDLDDCDPASITLLELLVSDLTPAPILFAVSADLEHGRHGGATRAARDRLRALSHVSWVRLRPLGREAVRRWFAQVLGGDPDEPLVRYVYGHTEGNAFFIEQVLRSLVEEGELDRVSSEGKSRTLVRPPEAVAEVVRRRLDLLSSDAKEVIQIAAVIGRDFDVDLLLGLTRLGEEQVLRALDEAEEAGILMPIRRSGGDWYEFTHGKIGEVHALAMNHRLRRRLHQRIAEALERRTGVPPSMLAWHWHEADEPTRACDYALRAAEEALAAHDALDAEALAALAAENAPDEARRSRARELMERTRARPGA